MVTQDFAGLNAVGETAAVTNYNKGTMSRKKYVCRWKAGFVFINPFSYQPVDDQLSVDCFAHWFSISNAAQKD